MAAELQADWERCYQSTVFDISHCFQHHVELLTPFITQMKSTVTGNKLLILPAALKMNLGELGRCVLPSLLGYCNTFIVVFFVCLFFVLADCSGEGRVQSVRGSGRQISFKKKGALKSCLCWVVGLW